MYNLIHKRYPLTLSLLLKIVFIVLFICLYYYAPIIIEYLFRLTGLGLNDERCNRIDYCLCIFHTNITTDIINCHSISTLSIMVIIVIPFFLISISVILCRYIYSYISSVYDELTDTTIY